MRGNTHAFSSQLRCSASNLIPEGGRASLNFRSAFSFPLGSQELGGEPETAAVEFSHFDPLKPCQNKFRLRTNRDKPRMPGDTDLATVSAHGFEVEALHTP